MRVLYVCTANICRSASAEQLLRAAIANEPELAGVEIRSAGTEAVAGWRGCSIAPALVGHAAERKSQVLTAELVEWADLILPAARDHRPAILTLVPTARTRTFTVRQAGRISQWLVDEGIVATGRDRSAWMAGAAGEPQLGAGDGAREGSGSAAGLGGSAAGVASPGVAPAGDAAAWAERFPPGDPRRDVQPLPDDPAGRLRWMITEMDAARGLAVMPSEPEEAPAGRARRLRIGRGGRSKGRDAATYGQSPDRSSRSSRVDEDPSELHPDDVPDPHVLGTGLHALAYEQITTSTEALVRLLREVGAAG